MVSRSAPISVGRSATSKSYDNLDLSIAWQGDTINIAVERVTIEPFDLRQPCKYDVVLDRLTHWYHTSREWIKKAILMDGLYVLNNPWSVQSMEKHTSYCAMMALGMPIPETVDGAAEELRAQRRLRADPAQLRASSSISARSAKQLGYPMFMKPYDGGGWRGVTRITDEAALRKAYDESGKCLMHLQAAVHPFDSFVRCIGLGPQTRLRSLRPGCAPPRSLHPRAPTLYRPTRRSSCATPRSPSTRSSAGISIRASRLRKDGQWYPIDFANPCPDSQVTSLHGHFPWMVKANLRWSIFCAVTKRAMRKNLDWEPFYAIAAEEDMSYRDKLHAYAAIARERLEAARFEEFCAEHLGHLDEVAWEFFGSNAAKEAFRAKVTALYPEHEVEQFTELFWQRVQAWRADSKQVSDG